MKTLTLKEAAGLLHINPEVLRQRTKAGIIPGSKPGRCWVFIEEDLINFIRSQYAVPAGQAEPVAKEELCRYSVKASAVLGTSESRDQMVSEYNAALALPIE